MQNKFKGALLGLAVGDALGGPLSFMSASQIQIKHGVVSDMIGGGWLNLRVGQYTDDTILMSSTAESLLERNDFSKEDLVERYLAWYRTDPKDIGQTTRSVLALVEQKKGNVEQASEQIWKELAGKSDDNDLLPRCLPLALFYPNQPEILVPKTFEAAKMTHFDKKIASGPVALNLVIARILNGETDRKKILEQVSQLLDDNESGVYNILPEVGFKKKDDFKQSSRMQDTLEIALWCWLKTKTYKDAVITAVNLGGDSDTSGAITGALAGAYYGEEQIPETWLGKLEDKNIIAGLGRKLCVHAEKSPAR